MDLSQFRLKTVNSAGSPSKGFQVAPFSARAVGVLSQSSLTIESNDAAVKLSLKGRKGAQTGASGDVEAASPARPDSGIKSLLKEVKSRNSRIQQLQEARSNIAAGTEQYESYTNEITSEQQALQETLNGPAVGKIFDIIKQVQGAAQGGASPQQLASALQSNSGLLGDDFIARVGNGEFSQIALFGGYLSTIQSAVAGGDFERPGFSDLIDSAVSGALRALDGPSLPVISQAAESNAAKSLVAPLPEIEQISFGHAEGLAVSIRGYIRNNAVQAAMAHLDYDARDAVVLLSPPKAESEQEKIDREKKKDQDADARVSAGLRPESDDSST